MILVNNKNCFRVKHVFLLTGILFVNLLYSQWTWQNPLPSGTKQNNIYLIDSLNAWIVGDQGLILHTNDGGINWETQFCCVSYDLIAISFVDENHGWAISSNKQILSTINGGNSWIKKNLNFSGNFSDIQFIDLYNGWIVGTNGLILKTINGGETWDEQICGINLDIYAVCFIDSLNGWITGKDGLILHTYNGCETWTEQSFGNGHNVDVYFTDSLRGWVIVRSNGILYTNNGGNSWSQQYELTSSRSLYMISFSDPDNGWVIGNEWTYHESFVLHTSNGGENWEINSLQSNSFYGISSCEPHICWIVGEAGNIKRTIDYGNTWESLSHSISNERLCDVSFPDILNGWVVGGKDILHTDNGGVTWQKQIIDTVEYISSVEFVNSNIGWVVGESGIILHTDDGGNNWIEQESGVSNGLSTVCFTDENNGWIVGHQKTVLHTINGGENWEFVDININQNRSLDDVFFYDSQNGWIIGEFGIILHTSDSGNTWEQQYCPISIDSYGAVFFSDLLNGWIVGEYNAILKTTDGGENWLVNVYGCDGFYFDVYFTDSETGWVVGWKNGDGIQILFTDNGGENWTKQYCGVMYSLFSVTFPEPYIGWIVGINGTILHTDNGGIVGFQRPAIVSNTVPIKNYPNPFTSSTTVEYELEYPEKVEITIYDQLGKIVFKKFEGKKQEGKHLFIWEPQNLSQGIYYLKIKTNMEAKNIKMVFLKP